MSWIQMYIPHIFSFYRSWIKFYFPYVFFQIVSFGWLSYSWVNDPLDPFCLLYNIPPVTYDLYLHSHPNAQYSHDFLVIPHGLRATWGGRGKKGIFCPLGEVLNVREMKWKTEKGEAWMKYVSRSIATPLIIKISIKGSYKMNTEHNYKSIYFNAL